MTEKITEFYRKKFQDDGKKETWCSKEEAEKAMESITMEEFGTAVEMIKVKAVT